MTDRIEHLDPQSQEEQDLSIFVIANVLLERRVLIFWLAVAGAAFGLTAGLSSPRVFRSTSSFSTQSSDGSLSGLSSLVSQLGIRASGTASGWYPPLLYVELLKSQALLEPIALDTIKVRELNERKISVMDLFEIDAPSPELRLVRTIEALRGSIRISEESKLNLVRVSVATKWPSVSLAITERLLLAIDQFSVGKRRAQALAEQEFAERQAGEAELALRQAEDRMQDFRQTNRVIAEGSRLAFDKERLQRNITVRQTVYTALLQGREEARLRAVRDVPVLTVLERPRMAVMRESRGTLNKGILGGVLGFLLGALLVFVAKGTLVARKSTDPEAVKFMALLESSIPRFLLKFVR